MTAAATLLEVVRAAARPGIWSTGVNLNRQGAVTLQSKQDNEAILRVKAPGRPVPW